MKQSLLFIICMVFVFSQHVHPQSSDKPLRDSAHSLREQLKQEHERAKELEKKKKQLESLLESRQNQLHRYEDILYNYRYNLNEAQKVIEAAEEEIKSILKRRQNQEQMLNGCVHAYARAAMQPPLHDPAKRLQQQTVKQAAATLSRELFREMQAEAPRLDELQNLIQDRLAYQSRIVNEYMPADIERRENQEESLKQTKSQVQETQQKAQTASKNVKQLREKIAAAEEKIAEIRRQRMEEERKRREAQAQKQQPDNAKAKPSQDFPFDESEIKPLSELMKSNSPTTTTSSSSAKQEQGLKWPAQGRIIRPYGEFTHPEFQVKMMNHGINVQVSAGSTLRAAATGRIQFVGSVPSLGNTIIIDHGHDFMTIYSNIMANSEIRKGIIVKRKDPLGSVIGSDSKGQAVYHFEVRKGLQALNPLEWLPSQ